MSSPFLRHAATPVARRGFLGRLTAGAAALLGGTLASPLAAQVDADEPLDLDAARAEHLGYVGQPALDDPQWDMSWVDRLTAPRRQVFDAPEIAEGTVLSQARLFYVNYKEILGVEPKDLNAVIVIRHAAVPMLWNDAIWAKYPFIGKKWTKLNDPTTGKPALRNPFINGKPDDKYAYTWPDGGLDQLVARGAIVLGCAMAIRRRAGMLARETGQKPDDVHAEVKANLVPGTILMPSGVFGVLRAEEAGCSYIRGT